MGSISWRLDILCQWVILQGHINMLIIIKSSNQFKKPVKHDLWRHTHPKRKIHWHIWLQLQQALHKLHIHKQHSLHSIAWLLKSSPYPGSSSPLCFISHHFAGCLRVDGQNSNSLRSFVWPVVQYGYLILRLRMSQWKLSQMGPKLLYLYKVVTWSSVLINQVSLFQGCPLRAVPCI